MAPRSHAPPAPRTGCPRRWQVPSQEEVRGRPSGALLTFRNHLASGSLSWAQAGGERLPRAWWPCRQTTGLDGHLACGGLRRLSRAAAPAVGVGGWGWTESSGHVARGCGGWGPCLELPTPRGRAGSGVPREQRPAPPALRSPEGAAPWPDWAVRVSWGDLTAGWGQRAAVRAGCPAGAPPGRGP